MSGAGEERLLREAARRIALQLAAGLLLLLAVVGAAVFAIDRSAARRGADDTLERAAATADDVRDPPADVYLVLREPSGRLTASPGTPAAAASGGLLDRAPGFSDLSSAGRHFRVLTAQDPDGDRVQALLDTRTTERERERLLVALLAAAGFGVPLAAGVGLLLVRRAIRPLADALALQRRFVADASHELRAPLTLLHTRAQLLARSIGGGAAPGLSEQLDLLVRDTRTLGEVVEDLLVSAELEHRPADRRPVDLGQLARDVVASFSPSATQAGVRLAVDAPGTGEPVVLGAAPALRRALSALVDNALGHVRPGDEVRVQVGVDGRSARLVVTDTGVGLDPAQAGALLSRFARGDGAPGPGRRFGLGLALVSEVLSAHGGRLLVDGAPGSGATFTVVLPLAPALPVRSQGGPVP